MAIYDFNHEHVTGTSDLKSKLGGKGAGLNQMTREGMPVPEGFTITCGDHNYTKNKMHNKVNQMAYAVKRSFNGLDAKAPMILSVRSGAPVSMPGMMDTILNLGLNPQNVEVFASEVGEDSAYACFRRFTEFWADIIKGMGHDEVKSISRVASMVSLTEDHPDLAVAKFWFDRLDIPFSPIFQLEEAIDAVFQSWNSEAAKQYRQLEGISGSIGTAVNVQRMVFGNLDDNSATGVVFSRCPNTGNKVRYGDFLIKAQGEDVVDGSHTTERHQDLVNHENFKTAAEELEVLIESLEKSNADMVDIEYTIESGKLYILQSRVGKRTPNAHIAITNDLLDEGIITQSEAKERLAKKLEEPKDETLNVASNMEELDNMNPAIKDEDIEVIEGTMATPGFGAGKIVRHAHLAPHGGPEAFVEKFGPYILAEVLTTPDMTSSMRFASAIITQTGGVVSHAAVVSRAWGKPCIVGAQELDLVLFGPSSGRYGAIENEKFILMPQGSHLIIATKKEG